MAVQEECGWTCPSCNVFIKWCEPHDCPRYDSVPVPSYSTVLCSICEALEGIHAILADAAKIEITK